MHESVRCHYPNVCCTSEVYVFVVFLHLVGGNLPEVSQTPQLPTYCIIVVVVFLLYYYCCCWLCGLSRHTQDISTVILCICLPMCSFIYLLY